MSLCFINCINVDFILLGSITQTAVESVKTTGQKPALWMPRVNLTKPVEA